MKSKGSDLRFYFPLLFLILFFFAISSSPFSGQAGEMYKWVDEWGTTHFSDNVRDIPSNAKVKKMGQGNGNISVLSNAIHDEEKQPAKAANILPPDPGELGKKTLEGVDSDNDGLRDDVQRWIALTYSGSEKMRAVLTQRAKATQQFLLDADDANLSHQNALKINLATQCLNYIQQIKAPLQRDGFRINGDLKAEILNTHLRSTAFLTGSQHLSSTTFSTLSDAKLACESDPDLMLN